MRFIKSIVALGVRNPVFANLAMVCILIAGWVAGRGMIRETFPEFSLDHLSIRVPYPGASAAKIEESICIPVEEAIAGVPGIREISSSSAEGVGVVIVALSTGASTNITLQLVKDRVDRITSFPEEAEDPVVQEELIRHQVINVAIHGPAPERTLKRYARQVRDDLTRYPEISQVEISGTRRDEISIEVSDESLQQYGLSLENVMAAVASGSLDQPAGVLRTGDEEFILRVKGQRYTAAEFENLVVIARPDGTQIRLGQIADVRDGFEQTTVAGKFNGQAAVMIGVYKTPAQDASNIARLVRDYVAGRAAALPRGLTMSVWGDTSQEVDVRINMLLTNGLQGMTLVFLLLALFLNLRSAVFVAAGIPVSFAGALIVMGVNGETVNMVSLFALIMVTGIIVDDAIVVSESIHSGKLHGAPPASAAIRGAMRVALPVLGSSATTIAAFVPLLFVSGVMGKFIHVLPVVVIAAIVASSVEVFAVLPAHLRHPLAQVPEGGRGAAPRLQQLRKSIDDRVGWFIRRVYRPAVHAALRHRAVTLVGSAAALAVAVGAVVGGRTPFVLFPKDETNTLRTRIEFPEGTAARVTLAAAGRIEDAARRMNDDPAVSPSANVPLVRQVYSVVGEWTGFIDRRGSQLCEVTVELCPAKERHVDVQAIIDRWKEHIGVLPNAVSFSISRVTFGPTEKPLEMRVHGDDLHKMRSFADAVRRRLRGYGGVYDIEDDLIPGKRELRVSLKPAARPLGLTLYELAAQLRHGFHGGEAIRVQRGRDEVRVVVRYPEVHGRSLADLDRMMVRTQEGREIPFAEAATITTVRSYSTYWRQDGRRRIRIRADVDERVANTERILRDMERSFLPGLAAKYPGVTYTIGGQRAQMNESMASLWNGFTIAVFVIYALLAGMLRSYMQPVVIMAAIPLGLVGAVVGHVLMGRDLTLLSVFGVVTLSGVVVNDALVLLDQVNRNIRQGLPVRRAVAAAGEQRFRAVTLTTLTTVGGLLPLLLEKSTQARTLQPMVISLGFGIMFATVLTLFVVPALYLVVNDLRRVARWLWRGGRFPTAELVEAGHQTSAGVGVP